MGHKDSAPDHGEDGIVRLSDESRFARSSSRHFFPSGPLRIISVASVRQRRIDTASSQALLLESPAEYEGIAGKASGVPTIGTFRRPSPIACHRSPPREMLQNCADPQALHSVDRHGSDGVFTDAIVEHFQASNRVGPAHN